MSESPENKPIELHCSREFLNMPFCHEDGSISSQIILFAKTEDDPKISESVLFKIRDCFKECYLQFGVIDDDNFENSIYKVDVMINHLTRFKAALKAAKEHYLIIKNT